MKISTIALVVSCLFFYISNQALCETSLEITKEEAFSIYLNKARELNLPNIDISKMKYNIFNAGLEKEWYGKKVWDVACLHSGLGMKIDANSGIIRSLQNYSIDRLSGANPPVFEGGAKPTRNKDDIIKEAEGYLKVLNGGIPQDSFFDKAEYDVSHWRDSQYSYEGYWLVDWGRKTGGYKYRYDGVRVRIHEKYGLAGYGYVFFSDPPKTLIMNISKEKAIEIAKPFAKKMAKLFGYKSGEVLGAELQITNPNYFEGQFAEGFRRIGVRDHSKYPQSYSRLAWIVSFSWGYDKVFTKNYEPSHVWIDAETGEVLGGGG